MRWHSGLAVAEHFFNRLTMADTVTINVPLLTVHVSVLSEIVSSDMS